MRHWRASLAKKRAESREVTHAFRQRVAPRIPQRAPSSEKKTLRRPGRGATAEASSPGV